MSGTYFQVRKRNTGEALGCATVGGPTTWLEPQFGWTFTARGVAEQYLNLWATADEAEVVEVGA